jgi:undecaprenyl-diphosphatase
MSRFGPVVLPPLRADLAISRACLTSTNPGLERALQAVSWLADEKAVLAAATAIWIATRHDRPTTASREADQLLFSVMLAAVLPHLFKRLVRRRRPDRSLVGGRRNGVPHSGNAWNSFPSGHALHMGAIAGSVTQLCPKWMRPLVWPLLGALAGTRIVLLAHYFTDVLAGWTIGLLINRTVAATFRTTLPDRPGTPSR